MTWRPTRRERAAYERLAEIDFRLRLLRNDLAIYSDEAKQAEIERHIEHAQAQRQRAVQHMEVIRMNKKAKELREAFRKRYRELAGEYAESQSERYPQQFRDTEAARIKQEMRRLEAQFQNDMIVWSHGQRVEVARLRASDPHGDAATETRRLREQMEIAALAEQFPSRAQARNMLIPDAWRYLDAGNMERAQVYLAAAQRVGVNDGTAEREINRLLDATVPHRRQAVELEMQVAHEVELSRRDIAEAQLESSIGTPQELARASTTAKMSAYKEQREDRFLRDAGFDPAPTGAD